MVLHKSHVLRRSFVVRDILMFFFHFFPIFFCYWSKNHLFSTNLETLWRLIKSSRVINFGQALFREIIYKHICISIFMFPHKSNVLRRSFVVGDILMIFFLLMVFFLQWILDFLVVNYFFPIKCGHTGTFGVGRWNRLICLSAYQRAW